MPMGCLQNWVPTTSTPHALGSCILPDIKLVTHIIAPSSKPNTSAFKTTEAPVEFLYCLSGGLQLFATDSKGSTIYTQIHEKTGTVLHLPFCNGYSIARPNSSLQVVGLQISPNNLHQLAQATGCPLHSKLKRIIAGTSEPCFLQDTRLPLPMRITLQQIMACPINKGMSNLFLEYKKMELIYLQLTLLNSSLLKNNCHKRQHLHRAHTAKKILLNDLANPPSLQRLATEVGMSKAQLNNTFRTVFDDTVFGVLREERLKCAKKMLEIGTHNVTEVAYECGFSSPSHFTKAFSEQYGVRPKQYQTTVLNQQFASPI